MKIWMASIVAVIVQPIFFMVRLAPDYFSSPQPINGLGFVLISVIIVSAAAVLILGIPAFLILKKLQREGWLTLSVTGFVLGALTLAFSWPKQHEGYSAGMSWHGKYVDTYLNGNPTIYAWLRYGENVFYYGLHGLIGAIVFYAVWRKLNRFNKTPQATPQSSAPDP